ncbi:MAG: ParA family protein [Candidatus Hydrogenedentota bacterium]
MAIVLFANLKGGVAKTTNAVAVAECLAAQGYKTLAIDADHQCMMGELLTGEDQLFHCEQRRSTLHDLLVAMLDDEFTDDRFPHFIVDKASDIAGGLDTLAVLPCSLRIDDFQTNVAKARRGYNTTEEFYNIFKRRRRMFRNWLNKHYEYTIVDCPPSIPVQVRVMLSVADAFIIPSVPDRLSVRGSQLLVHRVRKLGYKCAGLGTLWSLHRKQTAIHNETIARAKTGAPPFDYLPRPFDVVIPNAAAIAKAAEPEQHPKTFSEKYASPFAKLFNNLCGEIIARCGRLDDV